MYWKNYDMLLWWSIICVKYMVLISKNKIPNLKVFLFCKSFLYPNRRCYVLCRWEKLLETNLIASSDRVSLDLISISTQCAWENLTKYNILIFEAFIFIKYWLHFDRKCFWKTCFNQNQPETRTLQIEDRKTEQTTSLFWSWLFPCSGRY